MYVLQQLYRLAHQHHFWQAHNSGGVAISLQVVVLPTPASHLPDTFTTTTPAGLQHDWKADTFTCSYRRISICNACLVVHMRRDDTTAFCIGHTDTTARPWEGRNTGCLGQDSAADLHAVRQACMHVQAVHVHATKEPSHD